MATLAPPFILCPLGDIKEFLGLAPDQQDNNVILTIGKNIAIRYHVAEQKQDVSWASSRHWLTSRVVYCPDFQKYGAVIDYTTVGLWDEHDSHLANLKKYKYLHQIYEVRPTKSFGTLVIFKNGNVQSLSKPRMTQESKSNQEIPLNEKEDQIFSVEVDEKAKYIFILTGNHPSQKTSSKCGVGRLKRLKIITLKVETGFANLPSLEPYPFATEIVNIADFSFDDETVLGTCILPDGDQSFIVYLCTDGFLYRRSVLPERSLIGNSIVGHDDGTRIANLQKCVGIMNPVVIRALDSSTIVLFGSDPSEEGAVVLIYDISYDLVISKQSLKLYSTPPIMEKFGLNVFVPVGLHILVLGLRITKSLLSSVIGRHQLRGIDLFEHRDPWIKSWNGDEASSPLELDDPEELLLEEGNGFEELVKLVKTLENHGQPQAIICSQVIPQIVENRNFAALNWCLDYFMDIPETFLITILNLLLSSIEKTEGQRTGNPKKNILEETKKMNYPSNRQINQILLRPFEQRQMIRSLRALDFETVKKFLEYLCHRLQTDWDIDLDNAEYISHVSNLMKWTCTLLDAHYPQFVFHNEKNLVDELLQILENKTSLMTEIEGLEPLLMSTMSKVSFQPNPSPHSKLRTETVFFN